MDVDSEPVSAPQLSKKEVKIDWFSGTGKGGQHRNKHQNSCRVTHIASGLVETRQGRKRSCNLEEAMHALAKRVHEAGAFKEGHNQNQSRKRQIGTGMRGDKFRTYRFQDDRVFDAMTGKSARCTKVMKGQFNLLW